MSKTLCWRTKRWKNDACPDCEHSCGESSRSPGCYESLEKQLEEIKENWLQLVGNADDQSPCDVVIARGDYETMMSLICGDS